MEERVTEEGKTLFVTAEDVARLMMEVSSMMMEKSSEYFKNSIMIFILTLIITSIGWGSLVLLLR